MVIVESSQRIDLYLILCLDHKFRKTASSDVAYLLRQGYDTCNGSKSPAAAFVRSADYERTTR